MTATKSAPPASMYVFSPAAARSVDRLCAQRYGISTLVLMENAAVHVAMGARLMAPAAKVPRVLIVAGTGNNGGDALAAARHLANNGAVVSILLVGDTTKVSADAKVQLGTCRRMKLPIATADRSLKAPLASALRRLGRRGPDVVVDGLFGTGLSRSVEGVGLAAIQAMNRQRSEGARIVAIDVPSGLDASTGKPRGGVVFADLTVTFVGLKSGMLAPEAIGFLGRVAIADIGVPLRLIQSKGKRLS